MVNKKMRNYLLLSVCLLLCCFINITCCYARNISLNGVKGDLNIGKYWMNDYHTNDGKTVYCIDPGSKTPTPNQPLYPMNVDKNFTAGLQYIASNAKKVCGANSKAGMVVAMRTFTIATRNGKTAPDNKKYPTYKDDAERWLNNKKPSGDLSCSYDLFKGAMELYDSLKNDKDKSETYFANNLSIKDIRVSNPLIKEKNGKTYLEFRISGFNKFLEQYKSLDKVNKKNVSFSITGISCPDCKKYGMEIVGPTEKNVIGEYEMSGFLGTNSFPLYGDNNLLYQMDTYEHTKKDLIIRFEIKNWDENVEVCPTFKLKYKASYYSYDTEIVIYDSNPTPGEPQEPGADDRTNNTQRMIEIIPVTPGKPETSGEPGIHTITSSISMILHNEQAEKEGYLPCDDIPDDDDDDDDECISKITVPVCDDDDPKKSIASYEAPTNIKKCIIDKNDEAGNSYQLAGSDNSYCSVYCKEDYPEIRLNPVIKGVVCGQTFKLESFISGSKTCYVGGKTSDKSINRDAFKRDVKEYQSRMLENYGYYMATLIALDDLKQFPDGQLTQRLEGSVMKEYVINQNADGSVNTGIREYKLVFDKNIVSDDMPDMSGVETKADLKKLVENLRDDYKRKMNNAHNNLIKAIGEYNSCTTWTNDFKFSQKIKWYYDEIRQDEEENGKPNDVVKRKDAEYFNMVAEKDRYLKPEGEINPSLTEEYCLGIVGNNYDDCSNTKYHKEEVFKNVNFTVRYIDNNGNVKDNVETKAVSQAKFVKKSVSKSQKYKTPDDLYATTVPDGHIILNKAYENSSTIQYEPIIGLPTAFNLVGGGDFELNIEDLGEFYDSGNVGRIINYVGNDESKENTVAYALNAKNKDSFNGNYKCHYYSKCNPCPNCETDSSYKFHFCKKCDARCINCLFDAYNMNLNFKVISSTNIKDQIANNQRVFGYNWDITNTYEAYQYIKGKASDTLDEIALENEQIYDKDTSGDNLAFSVVMTPKMTKYIRNYNKEIEDNEQGSYNNDSITCYDYEGYKNIICYSDFLDELSDNFSDNEVGFNENRAPKGDRVNNPNGNGYWTLSDKYNDYKNEPNIIGGPSWK